MENAGESIVESIVQNQFKKNFFVRQPNVQQQLQEMAKYVVNSRSSFARIFILAESMQFRSSPLLVAAKRYMTVSSARFSSGKYAQY